MAESVINYATQRLTEVLVKKAQFLKGVHGEVEWLRDELQRMHAFLKDADSKQEEDPRVRHWVDEIRNAAYDAEDIVDIFLLKIESRRRKSFVERYSTFPKELFYLRKVGKELEALRVRISNISKSCETYGIRRIEEGTSSTSIERLHQLRRSSPRGLDKDIIGMEKDTTQLVAQLLKKENRLTLISLVGMGGIGKTTLAKKVFNHEVVRDHFNICAWIYVSQKYSLKDILLVIIKQVIQPIEMMENKEEEELERMLYEHLQEKRYLLVLDDIWTMEAWDLLKGVFPDMGNGSKVMLTTRNKDVALHANLYELRLLGKEESWELFLRKAFLDSTGEKCSQEFEEIGRRIVDKCDGLPLAIIVAGGLLCRKKSVYEWEMVLNNINSHFAKGEAGVLAILAMSYNDLPHYLKSCFLYFSLLHDGFVFRTRRLFNLWIAEGLILEGEKRMEEIAEDFLNELIDRNMVQAVRTNAHNKVKVCRMHDLLRDLSISKAKGEIFIEIYGNEDFQPSIKSRHHVIFSNVDRYFASKPSVPRLRSLLFFNWGGGSHFRQSDLDIICKNFKLLRVFDSGSQNIDNLQREFGKLIHLRYLHLRITKLPTSMRYLQSLETLDVSGGDLAEIPNFIGEMGNLQHLHMNGHKCEGKLRIDTLKNLQTLYPIHMDNLELESIGKSLNLRKLGVVLDDDSDVNRFCNAIAGLEQLKCLQLVTEYRFAPVKFSFFPSLLGLSQLHHLTKLTLRGQMRMLPLPHEFPPNISQLTLKIHCFNMVDAGLMFVLKQLPKLSILKMIIHCQSKHMVILAGGFPLLEFLELEDLGELQLTIEDGALPKIRHLRITFKHLLELPVGIMSATTLQKLEICKMSSEFVNRLQEEESYKIKHIPSVTFS